VVDGLRYIRRDSVILILVIYGMLHIVCGQPFMQLMPVFTDDVLKVGATGLGLLMTASGIGAVLSSLVLASLPNRRRGLMLMVGGLVMGVALIGFSFSGWWYLSLFLMPFVGMGPATHMTLTATLVQTYVKPDYRGRMQSFVMMGSGLASLGTFLASVMAESIGVQWSIGGMAMLLALVSLAFMVFARRLTRLE
jgi:MFS family permease